MTPDEFLDLLAEKSILDLPDGRELFLDAASTDVPPSPSFGVLTFVGPILVSVTVGEDPRRVPGTEPTEVLNRAIAIPAELQLGALDLKLVEWSPSVTVFDEVRVTVKIYCPEVEE